MKKFLQLSFLLVLALLTSIPISAHDFEVDGIYYNILDESAKTVEVTFKGTSYTSYANEYKDAVVIPPSIIYGGISYSVIGIGEHAFGSDIYVSSVSLPNTIATIKSYAFWNCNSLTSITIPFTVTQIENRVFGYCPNLTSISVEALNEIYDSRDNCNAIIETKSNKLIAGCKNTNIPKSVTSIGEFAFYFCLNLTSVAIPNTVTDIGGSAFNSCSSLTSITIPNSVVTIGALAFYDCSNLTSISIPQSVAKIHRSAFEGTGWYNKQSNGVLYLGDWCLGYKGEDEIGDLIIKEGCCKISEWAFLECSGLTSVVMPNSLVSIDLGTFEKCYDLRKVVIGNSVIEVGKQSFMDCSNLKEVYFGSSVKNINKSAFDDCTNLSKIVFSNSITSIGDCAFNRCTGLTDVTIPNSVTFIGGSAFHGCTELTSIVIPNSVKEINSWTFSGCSKLSSITIPETVTKIGTEAFSNCVNLAQIKIPDSLTEIGSAAFYGCTSLESIAIPNSVTAINNFTFYGCSNLSEVIIPNSVDSIGISAFRYCCSLTNIKIPNTLSYVNRLAFYGCTGLINAAFVTTPTSVTFRPTTQTSYKPYFYYQDYYDGSESLNNLDPNTDFSCEYGLVINDTHCKIQSSSFTTSELAWANGRFDATSTSSARLTVETNCDATAGTGYEWRRIDAPDLVASSKVACPVVDGMLVGTLRNLNPDVYYKFRPYYTSANGNTYYGDWVGFYTADANVYFEPEVRTYSDYSISQNTVSVKGYALEGTDAITSQGFEYWKTGSAIAPLSVENRMTVTASGITMSATLSDLEYDSTYKCRAFVTTARGSVYGEEIEFTIGGCPTGIENIETESDEFKVVLRENPISNTAWINVTGTNNETVQYVLTTISGSVVTTGVVVLDSEWNAIEINCNSGMYLLTVNNGGHAKTLRLIVK